MKTIRIIDLLNKIANGERVPKKIKYHNIIFEYNKNYCNYFKNKSKSGLEALICKDITIFLNDEVEVIEKNNEEIETATLKKIRDTFKNGFDKIL